MVETDGVSASTEDLAAFGEGGSRHGAALTGIADELAASRSRVLVALGAGPVAPGSGSGSGSGSGGVLDRLAGDVVATNRFVEAA